MSISAPPPDGPPRINGDDEARIVMMMIRACGTLLTVGSLGEFTDTTASPMMAPIMLVGGFACISARDGFPALRVLGVLLTLTAIGMVGDGGPSEQVAVAMTVAAAVALRIESTRCLICGLGMNERDGWRFCAQCGTRRGKRRSRMAQ